MNVEKNFSVHNMYNYLQTDRIAINNFFILHDKDS